MRTGRVTKALLGHGRPREGGVRRLGGERAGAGAPGGGVEQRAGCRQLGTFIPLPTTVMPDAVTWKPRERSSSGSMPIRAPSATITFLSRIARRTTACLPMSTLSISTLSLTVAQLCTSTFGESTEFSTSAPEITEPGETIEFTACPILPCQPCTNLAGGKNPVWV